MILKETEPTIPTTRTIHLRHDQIICACYEWVARRGFRPVGPQSMTIQEEDQDGKSQGDRKRRYILTFECDAPCGDECWDTQGRYYPYTTRSDVPWLNE